MSTAVTWRKPTVYIGRPKLEHPDHQLFHVIGTPYPIYRATVRQTGPAGRWEITWHTGAFAMAETFPTAQAALQRAYEVIGEATARDWHGRFGGEQRILMGAQRCPYNYGADVHCGRSIEVGTVWCRRHPWGKVLST